MAESKYLDPKYHHLFESEVVTGRSVSEDKVFYALRGAKVPPEKLKDPAERERYRKYLEDNPVSPT